MLFNNVAYNSSIEEMILMHLDGWVITENTINQEDTDVQPFITNNEPIKANKTITRTETRLFYEEALDSAFMYTNRLNINDLNRVEANMFIRCVCKWTASNLWNKYNIRVNNEDMEDTYVSSYGGLLYKSALSGLRQFINQNVSGLHCINCDKDTESVNPWMR